MTDRFAVIADRHVVGVAVRTAGGFRFFTSDPAFEGLEGRVYPRARVLEQHARQHSALMKRRRARKPVSQS